LETFDESEDIKPLTTFLRTQMERGLGKTIMGEKTVYFENHR
jgi:hypothetical protein